MQTISFLLFRPQESGLGSQDILSENPWNIKKIFFRIFQIFFGSKLSETDDLTKNICCLFP